MFTVVVLVATLSVLVFVHEFGHFIAAKWSGIRVDEFAIGMGPKVLTIFNDGETEYNVRLFPIGGFVRLLGENGLPEDANDKDKDRAFVNKSPLIRSIVLTAGIIMNYLLAVVVIAIIFIGLGKPKVDFVIEINNVAENSPAQKAGLKQDMIVTGYKATTEKDYNRDFSDQETFINFVQEHKGEKINLLVKSSMSEDSKESEKTVFVRKNPPEGEGSMGIQFTQAYTVDYEKVPLWAVPGESIAMSIDLSKAIFKGFTDMIGRLITQGEMPTDIAGPIGVAKITSDAAKQGIFSYLQILALISINLAIVNILPFPALDGGRLVFVVFEGITGKKILEKYEGWVHTIGFIILLTLIALISVYDIKRFF